MRLEVDNMVKFGVHMGTNQPFMGFKIPEIIKSSMLADELGFNSIWLMDHLNWTPTSPKTQISDCFVVLGHLADKVKNATLGTCVTDPHRRHPAQTALAALTMQEITSGGFILGIGAGEAANIVDFCVPWNKPATRLIEAVKVIKLLWGSKLRKPVNFEGEFFNLDTAALQFKMAELPKLYIAANGPRTVQFTGEFADGWIPANVTPELYKKQLKILEKGGRSSEIEKCVEIWIAISKDDPNSAKRAIMAPASVLIARKEILSQYNIEVPDEVELETMYREPIRNHTKKQGEIIGFISKNVPEEVVRSVAIAGSPSEVIEQLDAFIKVGVEHFIFEFIGDYFNSLKLFAKEVMPQF